jgi:DNA-binding MarR family transcriptional regulator
MNSIVEGNEELNVEDDLGLVDGLAQLSFLIQGMLVDRAAGHDLSIIQTRLLGVLRDREPTMKELALLLDLDKSSATGLVNRAEARGLVRRAASPNDRRAIRVALTAKGRRLVARVGREFERDVEAATSGLSLIEQKRLSASATQIIRDHHAMS